MPETVLELAERGRALAPQEREQLVELLVESLVDSAGPEVSEAWDREIERRVAAHQRGEVEIFDLEDVLADARRLAP